MANGELGENLPFQSPVIEVQFEDETIEMRWENTLVCKYLVGDGEFDHVLVKQESHDPPWRIFKPTDDLAKELEEKQYPYRVDPIVDRATQEWFVTVQLRELEEELGEIEGRPDGN